jgi:hypothetical protein
MLLSNRTKIKMSTYESFPAYETYETCPPFDDGCRSKVQRSSTVNETVRTPKMKKSRHTSASPPVCTNDSSQKPLQRERRHSAPKFSAHHMLTCPSQRNEHKQGKINFWSPKTWWTFGRSSPNYDPEDRRGETDEEEDARTAASVYGYRRDWEVHDPVKATMKFLEGS